MDQLSGSQILFHTDDDPEFQMKVQKKEHMRIEGELRKGYARPMAVHQYLDEGMQNIVQPAAIEVPPEMIAPVFFQAPVIHQVAPPWRIIDDESTDDDILEAYPHLKDLFNR